jgi:hypothetical protein
MFDPKWLGWKTELACFLSAVALAIPITWVLCWMRGF